MIRIRVEMIPGGIGEPQLLGEAVIANDGTGSFTTGNYTACFTLKRGVAWRRGRVEGFKRGSHNAWYLLYHLLKAALVEPDNALRRTKERA